MDISEEHHLQVALEISARAAGLEERDPTLLQEKWKMFLQQLAKGPNPLETPPAKLSLKSPGPGTPATPGAATPNAAPTGASSSKELDLDNKACGGACSVILCSV